MKKTYIAPELNIINVHATMLSNSTIDVDPSKGTTSQYSKRNAISFDDDEDFDLDIDGKW